MTRSSHTWEGGAVQLLKPPQPAPHDAFPTRVKHLTQLHVCELKSTQIDLVVCEELKIKENTKDIQEGQSFVCVYLQSLESCLLLIDKARDKDKINI